MTVHAGTLAGILYVVRSVVCTMESGCLPYRESWDAAAYSAGKTRGALRDHARVCDEQWAITVCYGATQKKLSRFIYLKGSVGWDTEVYPSAALPNTPGTRWQVPKHISRKLDFKQNNQPRTLAWDGMTRDSLTHWVIIPAPMHESGSEWYSNHRRTHESKMCNDQGRKWKPLKRKESAEHIQTQCCGSGPGLWDPVQSEEPKSLSIFIEHLRLALNL